MTVKKITVLSLFSLFVLAGCNSVSPSVDNAKLLRGWDEPTELDSLQIPPNWTPFKNYNEQEKQLAALQRWSNRYQLVGPFSDFLRAECPNALKNWKDTLDYEMSVKADVEKSVSMIDAKERDKYKKLTIQSCFDPLVQADFASKNITNTVPEILLYWSRNDSVKLPTSSSLRTEYQRNQNYTAIPSISAFTSLYVLNYDRYTISLTERKEIEAYLARMLMEIDITGVRESGRSTCDANDLSRTISGIRNGRIDADGCGSSMWKTSIARLLFGLKFNNEVIFEKGISDIKWQMNFFDADGTFVTWALKGPNAYHYSNQVSQMLGVVTEIFGTLGYNFLNYENSYGVTVKRMSERQVEIFKDPHELDEYVMMTSGYRGVSSSKYLKMTRDEIIKETHLSYAALARNMSRYAKAHDADLYDHLQPYYVKPESDYERGVFWKSVNSFMPVDPYMIFSSNN